MTVFGVILVVVGALVTMDALSIRSDLHTLKSAATNFRSSKNLSDAKHFLTPAEPAINDISTRTAHLWIRPALWVFLGIKGANSTVSALHELSFAFPNISSGAQALAASSRQGFAMIDLPHVALAERDLALAEPHLLLASQDLQKVKVRLLPSALSKRIQNFISVSADSSNLLPAIQILQNSLGASHAMRWLVVAQNSAESRGTGGIVGAYAIVTATNGRTSVERVGSNTQLHSLDAPPINLGSDFNILYGTDPGIWQNANLSPDFPSGAQIMAALWQKQSGEQVDGVIAVDPFVLAAILKATGPIHPQGGVEVNSANVVAESLSLAYQRFAKQTDRKLYLASLFRETLKKMLAGGTSPVSLALALRDPLGEKRILVWSRDNGLENELRRQGVAGDLASDGPNTYRVVVANSAGNKMDYYLDRQVDLQVNSCTPQRKVRIKASFLLNVPRNERLVDYVAGRLDLGKPTSQGGSSSLRLSFYAPKGSSLDQIFVDGQSIGALEGAEKGHDVVTIPLELSPRKTSVVEVDFVGPASYGLPEVLTQPLVRPQFTNVSRGCSRFAD